MAPADKVCESASAQVDGTRESRLIPSFHLVNQRTNTLMNGRYLPFFSHLRKYFSQMS